MSNFNLDNVTQINILASHPTPPPILPSLPGVSKVGIYRFCLNLNRSAFLGCAGSHIHVNMNMKMTRWLSDMGCMTTCGWVCANLFNNLLCVRMFDYMCVCLSTWSPSWQVCDTDSMWASFFSTEAFSKHFLLLPYSLSSASNTQPATVVWKCRTDVGGVRKRAYPSIMCECNYTHKKHVVW